MKKEIDHSIDVRYETDVIEAFNKFIEKWCGNYAGHLLDDDENDGQFMREKITEMVERELEKGVDWSELEESLRYCVEDAFGKQGEWTYPEMVRKLFIPTIKQYVIERKK